MSDKKRVTANLDVIVERLDNLLEENSKEHEAILKQTTSTNGRVKKLEMWRFGMVMAGSVITFAVIPLIMYIYFDKEDQIQKRIDQSVRESVASILSQYNIQVIN